MHDEAVHGAAGWIKQGYFVPAYTNGSFPFGYAWAYFWNTTDAFYNIGAIGAGYDVGLVTLRDRQARLPSPLAITSAGTPSAIPAA